VSSRTTPWSELGPFDLSGPLEGPELLRLALAELERVHRAELAQLLREAAAAGLGARGRSLEALREDLREALRCAEADGLALPSRVLATLRRWLDRGSVRSSELVRASLQLERTSEGRRLLARALLGGEELA
jgi:hypothetical protein